MALTDIGGTIEAGNATDATIYTTPASTVAIIGNIVAYNTTGGALVTAIKVKRQNGTTYTLDSVSISATSSQSYSGGSTRRLTPLVLHPGELLIAQAAGAGVNITYSGLQRT